MPNPKFPAKVAYQSGRGDTPTGSRGDPAKFHKKGAKHLEKGADYTKMISLAKALSDGWEPCKVCFRDLLVSPAEELRKAVASVQHLSDADLLSDLPDPNEPADRETRLSPRSKRSAKVVVITFRRAGDRCEMPGCKAELFPTDSGEPYLEVHHLKQLSDGGADHPSNTAALCPSHHRQLHLGKGRQDLLDTLRPVVEKAQKAFVAQAKTTPP